MIRHQDRHSIIRDIILGNVSKLVHPNGRHRRASAKTDYLLGNRRLRMSPECGHIHPPTSEAGQIPHNKLALTAMPNLDDGETTNPRLRKSQLQRQVTGGQYAHVLPVHHRQVCILIDHVGSG